MGARPQSACGHRACGVPAHPLTALRRQAAQCYVGSVPGRGLIPPAAMAFKSKGPCQSHQTGAATPMAEVMARTLWIPRSRCPGVGEDQAAFPAGRLEATEVGEGADRSCDSDPAGHLLATELADVMAIRSSELVDPLSC
eukprot:5744348-Pyramimonas_sp.AAC.1